jgi:hypothetical protein
MSYLTHIIAGSRPRRLGAILSLTHLLILVVLIGALMCVILLN